ncbi:MAG: hypothetical protein MJY60_04200 [Bacteroidales bacterium]|nr:hypothetical protein [Bacteroidales bacterium]
MAEIAELGYNTIIKSSDKTFAGVTSDDLDLAVEQKESITKADAGTKRISITRVPATLTVSGVCSADSTTTVLDRVDIIDLVLAKAALSITYLVGTVEYEGTGYATGYKETTPADPDTDPTYTLTITCPNGLAKSA